MQIYTQDGSRWKIDQEWIDSMKAEASEIGFDLDVPADLAAWIHEYVNDDSPFQNSRLVHADKSLIEFLFSGPNARWSDVVTS